MRNNHTGEILKGKFQPLLKSSKEKVKDWLNQSKEKGPSRDVEAVMFNLKFNKAG